MFHRIKQPVGMFALVGATFFLNPALSRPAAAQSTQVPPISSAQGEDVQRGDANVAVEPSESTGDEELDALLAGHAFHGEAFNEGPRQRAYLMGGTGNVHFPVTTDSKLAQKFIDQGVGQLHGFWDLEAERSFRQAIMLDEQCAMAYWGAAMAAWQNRKRARGFIEKAMERIEAVTPREQKYIRAASRYFDGDDENAEAKKKRAMQYLKDLETIVLDHPNDLEAKAWVAHRIWQNAREGIPITSYVATDALLNEIFEQEPLHPAHHYCIHLWDYRKPERALRSAARCGPSAPAIAHMWHMPGHIYSRLKRYEDAVYQQEASARVDHRYMIRDRVLPDEIHNYAHNNEWLIRNLVFVGRASDARDLALNMVSLPRHPRFNHLDKRNGSFSYGRRRLLQVLREFQMYEQAVSLCQSPALDIAFDKNELEWIKTQRLLGCSAAILGEVALADQIERRMRSVLESQQKLIAAAEKPPAERDRVPDADAKKRTPAGPADSGDAGQDIQGAKGDDQNVNQSELADAPSDDVSSGSEEQKKQARAARAKAKSVARAVEKTLLAIDGYRDVANGELLAAAEKLTKAGGEDLSWIGELKVVGGEFSEGVKLIRDQVRRRPQESLPLARLVYALSCAAEISQPAPIDGAPGGAVESRAAGTNTATDEQVETADDGAAGSMAVDGRALREALEKLGAATRSLDMSVPVFARLRPIAQGLGLEDADWLAPLGPAADVGFRPDLDTLGPFRCEPPIAPKWTARDAQGNVVSSTQFEEKPRLIIFYLGHGCLHCVEQLQSFAPWVSRFEKDGIEVIAISTDTSDSLAEDIATYDGDMPYDIHLADPDGVAFRKFRAWDDFENQPLHGTFLVDRQGRVLWQDIGYEPFNEPEFLWEEGRRLLNLTNQSRSTGLSRAER